MEMCGNVWVHLRSTAHLVFPQAGNLAEPDTRWRRILTVRRAPLVYVQGRAVRTAANAHAAKVMLATREAVLFDEAREGA